MSLTHPSNLHAQAAQRAAQWKTVEEAIQKGLPQTAVSNLQPIIAAALADRSYAEATKAIARRIVLEGTIQGNKPEERITRLEAEISRAPEPIKPLLETIQATWYWHYFQQNRWRFLRRTATTQAPGADFTTWDLPRLFAQIDRMFTRALAAAEALRRIPISDFDDLIEKGTVPDRYRPTLYDFVAHEALKFYTSGEQAAARPADALDFIASEPVYGVVPLFGTAEEFLRGKIERSTEASLAEKALYLFRDLLEFHRADADPSAFADVDLERLRWAYNTATGDDKATLYKNALQAFAQRWADHELSALALERWARVVQSEGDWVAARALALRGLNAHRDSPGGRLCHNLVQEIEAPASDVTTERVWNDPWPGLKVRYRNITNLWFRAVAWDWSEFLQKRHRRPENLNDAERAALLGRKPALEWPAALPATPDYRERTHALPVPRELAKGFYFIIASHEPRFREADNPMTYTDVWVSDLALVVRPRAGQLEGFVLDASSGEPRAGAEVEGWYLDNTGNHVAVPKVFTDELGFFHFAPGRERHRGLLLRARHGGDVLATQHNYWAQELPRLEPHSQTMFFTDRALYRPGQTIRYKGICLRADQNADDYRVLEGQELTVALENPNGQEIARQSHRCNDYGSFHGSFTAPAGGLLGPHSLRVVAGPNGQTAFNVEEYKRPRFQVTLEAPKEAARIGERTAVHGLARSYTGAPIDGAEVRWHVVREVRFPWWCWWGWRGLGGHNASQEIAHGTARTGADGAFRIEFTAHPDLAVSPTNEPTFHFSIHADVTDGTGETRSAQRSVRVGYATLQATLTAEEWLADEKPAEVNIEIATLDGEPQPAEGTVQLYRVQQPARVIRPASDEPPDLADDTANPKAWPLGEVIETKSFTTDAAGRAKLVFKPGPGLYRAVLETSDRFGKKVTARLDLRVLQPDANRLALKIPQLLTAPKWSVEPGEEFMALWGTGYEAGRAFIEIEHRHRIVERFWTQPGRTQQQIRHAITEAWRGGFHLHVTQVRENRAYLNTRHVAVPWSNKELALKWEHFTSKLGPGQKETWTLTISNRVPRPPGDVGSAELVAALYDASLDQFLPHRWRSRFDIFRVDHSSAHGGFANGPKGFQHLRGQWHRDHAAVDWRYRRLPDDLVANLWGYEWGARGLMKMTVARGAMVADAAVEGVAELAAAATPARMALSEDRLAAGEAFFDRSEVATNAAGVSIEGPGASRPDLSQVSPRRNLNETAFFFPQLLSDRDGVVKLEFTMPEALTEWRFLGFAHDRALRSGYLEAQTVTAKDLMVQPNPPRFVREGDVIEFSAKVLNQSAARQSGRVRLTFSDARSGADADMLIGNAKTELEFDLPAKESRAFSWRINVPDGCGFLAYKIVASTGRLSDGEEGYLPVLPRRILVTESLPLPIRGRKDGPVTKRFEFEKLLKAGQSRSLVHQNLVVQMVSNPAWYAVLALPYLMEYPHECTEQTFNRFYANVLAGFVAGGDPKIRRVFDQWKGTPALDSPLEKNEDLKTVLLEETPWLRQAKNESQARRNVGVLVDANRLRDEAARALRQLAEAQLPNGAWPWFPGGPGNDYITLYITTGFGRLRHLGAEVDVTPALRSVHRLDAWMSEHYERIQQGSDPEDYVPSATDALYLYGRSFFLKDVPIAAPHRRAVEFFLAQSRKHWLKLAHRQSQGHLALALQRFNASFLPLVRDSTPKGIMRSIKERSVTSDELGMFWRDTESSWWWYGAPIETQALMIEAFDEVMGDATAVEECRVWLLKQKQTQDWKTTKATADAVYALLLRGRDILASDALVEVSLGGQPVLGSPALQPLPGSESRGRGSPSVEVGTGFQERRFTGPEIKAVLGEIVVRKRDEGVAWGGVHWQYLEDMGKVTLHTATPLKLTKSLFTKVNTKQGPQLRPVTGVVAVGDELVVRLELRVDRDMEYVHLKDRRGSGTEPVNVLSQYKYQDGLAYYESTRDTASHFFIDYLPKGTYVFEYSTRVQHRGRYQTGVAEIQCLYAPEFSSHSQSIPIEVH